MSARCSCCAQLEDMRRFVGEKVTALTDVFEDFDNSDETVLAAMDDFLQDMRLYLRAGPEA